MPGINEVVDSQLAVGYLFGETVLWIGGEKMLKGYSEREVVGGTTLNGITCTLYEVPDPPFLRRLFLFVTFWATPTHVKSQDLYRGRGLRALREDIEKWADDPQVVFAALDKILEGLSQEQRERLNRV